MNKEQYRQIAEKELHNQRMKIASIIVISLTILFASSIFFWLWHSWAYAWRVAVTSILLYLLFAVFDHLQKKMDKEILEKLMDEYEKEAAPRKSFREKLKDKMNER